MTIQQFIEEFVGSPVCDEPYGEFSARECSNKHFELRYLISCSNDQPRLDIWYISIPNQRDGTGRKVVSAIVAYATSKNLTVYAKHVRDDAADFWRKMGFECCDVAHCHFKYVGE